MSSKSFMFLGRETFNGTVDLVALDEVEVVDPSGSGCVQVSGITNLSITGQAR